ncbi:hypothetical protein BZG36_01347 [Bifiguratus adelaidae]|uniref:Major facilitator superfamily (MFS) profile domain-containing protein n=1 Tax=Bifiguratus adelaidae TaxID=1938954 RepID=A0A261Y3D0_9FUNG|nr:hypothetical protein BZG36_01347 [Bifiguratus adelaidae]
MRCIIVPATAIPIYVGLLMASRRARHHGKFSDVQSVYSGHSLRQNIITLFWPLDVIGVLLLSAALSLLLIPLTIAGGQSSQWHKADIIVLLVLGFLSALAFVLWELYGAKYPCLPFRLLNDRGIIAGLWVALSLNMCWYLQGDYLYTVLSVAFNESVVSATRITSLYSFCSVISGVVIGFLVRYIRRIKWIAVTGTLLFLMALGLMVKYRSSADNGHAGVIGAQVALGIAGGFFPYPVQVLVQAASKHEHVAMITALYLTMYQIGSAIGNAVSGAIWTNTLPARLAVNLSPFNNATLATYAYGSPLSFIVDYTWHTPERAAVIEAYQYSQKLLTITGTCLAVPLILAALLLKNPRLGDTQVLPDAELPQGAKSVE